MIILYIAIFVISCVLLFGSGKLIIGALLRIARSLNWKEFVVAFITLSFAASLPNLFVGIFSAIRKIPQLSFGDVVGGNVVDLTLAIALAVLFTRGGIVAKSRTVQKTSIFMLIAAILPIILILDKTFSRIDGIISILFFIFYFFWLFSKKERFVNVYNHHQAPISKKFKPFLADLGKLILGIILLLVAAEEIVRTSQFFAGKFGLPISLIGILVIGLGNATPEICTAIASARKNEGWMVLGDLMGSVIVPATLVIGIVALICPITIVDFSPFAIARIFLIISALLFFFFVKTDRKITKKEAILLLVIYIIFVLVEILVK